MNAFNHKIVALGLRNDCGSESTLSIFRIIPNIDKDAGTG